MSTPANHNSHNGGNSILDNEKCVKVKRFIGFAVLATLTIVGWHIYEKYFAHGDGDQETPIEHEISELTQRLFADELKQNVYPYSVNFQGKTKSFARDDRAPQPLLQIRNDLLAAEPTSTVNLMRRLFDNYELDVLTTEQVTAEQQQEEMDFLHAVLQSQIMKHTMRFLQQKGRVSADASAQLQLLKDIWFTQYSRSKGRMGSSGFEHVFLAEVKDESVLGLHNWIYFSEQESKGLLDYKGFLERIDLDKNKYVLATRFTFHDHVKPYNTLFVGTSPEFELSVYTVCFLLHVDQPCPVQLGSIKLSINTNVWDWRGRKTLASAYPTIEK